MWGVGRILLITLMVIGILLVAAGTASLVEADSWTDRIDDINIDFNIDTGVFMGAGDGGGGSGSDTIGSQYYNKPKTY